MPRRIVIIDDERDAAEATRDLLCDSGHSAVACASVKDALELIADGSVELVLTDLAMVEMSGLEVCERVIALRPDVPIVVITGQNDVESAVASLRAGAFDFISKPVDTKLLELTVDRAIAHRRTREELKRLRLIERAGEDQATALGASPEMRKVSDLVVRVATSEAAVLIHGETGTGKELVARAVHQASPRRKGPFVAVNCAAVPLTLIESELFGHARGAFTDAKDDRSGLFVQADGGTLFLDEIGELPSEVQPKLLRALQERRVRPVGSNTEVPFNARLVSATNRDLERDVEEKRFREDLFYRINVVSVEVPPLRAREGDVLRLADQFLKGFAAASHKQRMALSPSAAERLVGYAWPGNVRELENCIERAVALARLDQVTIDDLPEKVRAYRAEAPAAGTTASAPVPAPGLQSGSEVLSLEEVERAHVLHALDVAEGNKAKAAQLLGFDRRTLYRKLERYGAVQSDPSAPQA